MSEIRSIAAASGTDEPQADMSPAWRRQVILLGPWLIAAALIGFFFTRVPIEEAWSVARKARLDLFVPLITGGVVLWFVIESATYSLFFTRFNAPVSMREALSLRGMSYLLTPIHWNVGKAAVILRLRQTKGIPLLEATSTVMLVQAVDGFVLGALATTGLTLLAAQAEELAGVRGTTIAIVIAVVLNLALLRASWPRYRWLLWWRSLALHHAHRRLSARDFLLIVALKGAYHSVFILVFYFGPRAFGIELPFALALASAPIIQAVGALPITPAGLGTQQAAMLYFFGDRFGGNGSEAEILAFGFAFPFAMILGRCLLGLFYLKDLSRPAAEMSPDSTPFRRRLCTLFRSRRRDPIRAKTPNEEE